MAMIMISRSPATAVAIVKEMWCKVAHPFSLRIFVMGNMQGLISLCFCHMFLICQGQDDLNLCRHHCALRHLCSYCYEHYYVIDKGRYDLLLKGMWQAEATWRKIFRSSWHARAFHALTYTLKVPTATIIRFELNTLNQFWKNTIPHIPKTLTHLHLSKSACSGLEFHGSTIGVVLAMIVVSCLLGIVMGGGLMLIMRQPTLPY